VVFFDEPFEGLDDVALARVADMLTDVLNHRDSVFVITHEKTLQSAMPHSIRVIKEGGISDIEA
jgi:DNA repair exonuclease SbcCD ATPase subunit